MKTAMMNSRMLLVAALMMSGSIPVLAGNVKVIANPSVKADTISTDELRSIFLEERSSLSDGSHVEPVLARTGPAHDAFVEQYLEKSDAALQIYYRSLVFTGKGSMPKSVDSDAEVAAYVARTKGAIGCVATGTVAVGVKTLEVR
jgi:ABC-type phosphate transport system substrate-binding protein